MRNHPGIRAALMAAAGTLTLMAAACGAKGTTASGSDASTGPGANTTVSASASAAGEGGSDTVGGTGGTTTSKPPTPKASTTPKSSPSAATGPVIVSFEVDGKASCDESGPGFSAPGTVTFSWKVTGATKVGLSIDDPTFFSKFGKGSFDDYPAVVTMQTIPFGCDVPIGQTATHQYTLDTLDGGTHKSMTIKASAVNHG
jgi:hypothetical protein